MTPTDTDGSVVSSEQISYGDSPSVGNQVCVVAGGRRNVGGGPGALGVLFDTLQEQQQGDKGTRERSAYRSG